MCTILSHINFEETLLLYLLVSRHVLWDIGDLIWLMKFFDFIVSGFSWSLVLTKLCTTAVDTKNFFTSNFKDIIRIKIWLTRIFFENSSKINLKQIRKTHKLSSQELNKILAKMTSFHSHNFIILPKKKTQYNINDALYS